MSENQQQINEFLSKSPIEELKLRVIDERFSVLNAIKKCYKNSVNFQNLPAKLSTFLLIIKTELFSDNLILYNKIEEMIKLSKDLNNRQKGIEAFELIDKWLYESGILQFRDKNQTSEQRYKDE